MRSIGRRLASQRNFSFNLPLRTQQIISENSSNIKTSSGVNGEQNNNNPNNTVNNNNNNNNIDNNKNILTIKDSCLKRLERIIDKPDDKYLRINVEAGGCSGFLYLFDIETSENLNPSEDVIIKRNSYRVVIEKQVLPYIKGSQIEYEESLIKSSFKIINPIAESKCGCGASFSIDFNKKQPNPVTT